MDRLPPLIIAAALAAGVAGVSACKKESAETAEESEVAGSGGSRDRFNAVQARPENKASAEEMCDKFNAPDAAPTFRWPALASGAAPEARAGHWRWVNLWATWCAPCVEEIPLLLKWQGKLASRTRLDLVLVSADASDDEVAAFRKKHPETPEGPRLSDPDALPEWLKELGIPGASLPVHIFIDPKNRVRCVRASAVSDSDFAAAQALLGG